MQHDDEIKICANHKNQVPLIFTFRFPGAEYWCPYCGYQSGILGAGINVKIPDTDLLEQREKWEKKAEDFLSGKTDSWDYEQEI